MNDNHGCASSILKGRRPIMALLDLLGQKWTLRVLWELRDGAMSSRALRSAAGDISPTVLQSRINELRDAGIVERVDSGYSLTPLGLELSEAFMPLYRFAGKWADCLEPELDSF
ncbi:winged helix-turn-helix transcriptional regulator [Pseudomonas bijieensis]|uniref:winged helix-turn-helix transcriptional regulator n=1 Tax=Pseudomonas bijieensis TaxID=2681983 RepID=UPI001EF809BE|nr:helix-turn-helix domain-containing protein [Pseudomonas bijieensis]UQI28767.1 helix-turn-helix transcriptional regulator [Pseudomonas bijieensis]